MAENGCWVWAGVPESRGYGTIRRDGKNYKAHRWIYEREVGPVPEGMQLDHLCRNRLCVNPDHLEVVTNAENVRRGRRAKLTHAAVEEIRTSRKTTGGLARQFGVSPKTVRSVLTRRAWA